MAASHGGMFSKCGNTVIAAVAVSQGKVASGRGNGAAVGFFLRHIVRFIRAEECQCLQAKRGVGRAGTYWNLSGWY